MEKKEKGKSIALQNQIATWKLEEADGEGPTSHLQVGCLEVELQNIQVTDTMKKAKTIGAISTQVNECVFLKKKFISQLSNNLKL